MSRRSGSPPATLDDLLAIPEDERFHEILAGELVQKALPTRRHGMAQRRLGVRIDPYERRSRDPEGRGGWWFATEVDVVLSPHDLVRPDIAGWRWERTATTPEAWPYPVAPDWVAEIMSKGSERRDLLDKVSLYHRFEIPHYWVLDPETTRLRVHRWQPPGYQVILDVCEGRVRAEPFVELELDVAGLFDDPE